MTTDFPEPTIEQLEYMNKLHRKDLRLLKHMTDAQFKIFKKNVSVGILDDIDKAEAYAIVTSMLALNNHLIQEAKAKQKDKN